jgi:hypothetical protein
MKTTTKILVCVVASVVGATSVGVLHAQSRVLTGATITPRLDPFNPGATLDSGWTRLPVPTDERVTGTAFIPPSAIRPPFFPNPRSPYFPGPR